MARMMTVSGVELEIGLEGGDLALVQDVEDERFDGLGSEDRVALHRSQQAIDTNSRHRPGSQVQRHWEALESIKRDNVWSEVGDEFCADPREFQERHYKEFVTFLPYVQRFLYGSRAGQESSNRDGEPSLHVYRRSDIRAARVMLDPDSSPIVCEIARIDLHFFLDADITVLAFEIAADNLTLDQVQDLGFRFGRAYPAFWDSRGEGGNCPHKIEWLDVSGSVLASSDYGDRARYLEWVGRYRTPRVADHWEYLLKPLLLEYPGQVGLLRYRQLEYYRMPFMAYCAVDDPKLSDAILRATKKQLEE